MPIHDWTRVTAGPFHDFHLAWIAELRRVLNGGLLPGGYYALAEQVADSVIPDVLTLQENEGAGPMPEAGVNDAGGGVAVALAPPKVSLTETIPETFVLAAKRRQIVIRHTTGDRIVALIEIVSPGNKDGRNAFDSFLDKAVAPLAYGYHLLLIDLFPPGRFDPSGLHAALWEEFGGTYSSSPGKPLTLAAYAAGQDKSMAVTCYVEPSHVGALLIDMPLFLSPGNYVNVPLESTYMAAFEGVPSRWKKVIDA